MQRYVSRFILALALICGLSGAFCRPYVDPVKDAIVDCLAQHRPTIEAKILELRAYLPGGATPGWAGFKSATLAIAKATTIEIATCAAVEVAQLFLAPPPGTMAPPPEEGLAARKVIDELREEVHGAVWKTAHGDL